VRIWILTPCLLHADPDHPWNADLSEYRAACARVALRTGSHLVPTGEEFEAAVRARPDIKWTYDGVHPRPVGQERLAWTVYHHGMAGHALPIGETPPKPKSHRLGQWP
jgi:lysophospholipase L1-like esterase